eukprot:EG_transcript_21340
MVDLFLRTTFFPEAASFSVFWCLRHCSTTRGTTHKPPRLPFFSSIATPGLHEATALFIGPDRPCCCPGGGESPAVRRTPIPFPLAFPAEVWSEADLQHQRWTCLLLMTNSHQGDDADDGIPMWPERLRVRIRVDLAAPVCRCIPPPTRLNAAQRTPLSCVVCPHLHRVYF